MALFAAEWRLRLSFVVHRRLSAVKAPRLNIGSEYCERPKCMSSGANAPLVKEVSAGFHENKTSSCLRCVAILGQHLTTTEIH